MSICRVVALGFAVLFSSFVHAANQRSYVASFGNDANPCTLAQPCRNFSAAIAQTNDGGLVVALDSAGYGLATISKSLSIVAAPGVYAGITVGTSGFPPAGVFISVGNFNVTLRGLTINGPTSGGLDGIMAENSGTLNIDSCEISKTGRGIYVSSSGALKVSIKDTVIRDTSGEGIILSGGSGAITGVLDNVHVDRAGASGINLDSLGSVEVRNSVVEGSFAVGIRVDAFSALDTAILTVTNTVSSHNGNNGLFAFANHGAVTLMANGNTLTSNGGTGISGSGFNGGTAKIIATRNTVTLNATGFDGNGSTFNSAGDNGVNGNGTDVTGPINLFSWQ